MVRIAVGTSDAWAADAMFFPAGCTTAHTLLKNDYGCLIKAMNGAAGSAIFPSMK